MTPSRLRSWFPATALTAVSACAANLLLSLPGCSATPSGAPSPPSTVTPASSPHLISGVTRRLGGVAPGLPVPLPAAPPLQPAASPAGGWNVPTSTPVRASGAGYGAYVVAAPTDIFTFAVDNYSPSKVAAPGITPATAPASLANWSSLTATQQTEAEQSTVFVLTNLYAATPTLLGWNNTPTKSYTSIPFGLSFLSMNFDAQNLELYALSQTGNLFCWDVPSPQSSAGYAASQVGALSTCAGWSTSGKGTSGGKVTYSSPWPTYYGEDVFEVYWGDDTGHLSCVQAGSVAGDAGAGKAPVTCSTTYAGGAVSLGTTEALGVASALANSLSPGTSVETYVYVGSQYGTMYRIDDVQKPHVSFTKSMFCASTGVAGAPCPTTNTADYAIYGGPGFAFINGARYVYWVSHGTLYQAPLVGSGTGGAWVTSDVASVQLFTSTSGVPSFAVPEVDYLDSVANASSFIYVGANDALYKVAVPLSAGEPVYSTPLLRQALPQTLPISASASVSLPSGSWPVAPPLGMDDSIFVTGGYGSAQLGGLVGAPVSAGTLTGTAAADLEQYGCIGSAANPFLEETSTKSFGASIESDLLLDYEGGDLMFGYDTGGAAPTGGFVQYPAGVSPAANWSCPAPYTATGSACGSTTACVGPLPPGLCVNDSDCMGAKAYCGIFPDSSFGTCVQCRTDSQCPQSPSAYEVCDTNNGAYACLPTARCAKSTDCTNKTDDPDYNATLTSCDLTAGTTGFGLCGICGSNTDCAPYTSTPVCDVANPTFAGFGTCVECTSDADCTGNDIYINAGLVHCDQTSGSPNFDHCAACTTSSQCPTGVACATSAAAAGTPYFDTCAQCTPDEAAACGGVTPACDAITGACVQCTAAAPSACTGSTPLCDVAPGSPSFEKCVQCDAANPTCASGICDTNPSDSTFDTCVQCAPVGSWAATLPPVGGTAYTITFSISSSVAMSSGPVEITWSAPGTRIFTGTGLFNLPTCTLTETYTSTCAASAAAGNPPCGDTNSSNADLCPNGDVMVAMFAGTPSLSWWDALGCDSNGQNCSSCTQNNASSFASGPCASAAGAWTAALGGYTVTIDITAQVAAHGGDTPITWSAPGIIPVPGTGTFSGTDCSLAETYAVLCGSALAVGDGSQCGDTNSSNVDLCPNADALTGAFSGTPPSLTWWNALGCNGIGQDCAYCYQEPSASATR